jgi:hypothetical protein
VSSLHIQQIFGSTMTHICCFEKGGVHLQSSIEMLPHFSASSNVGFFIYKVPESNTLNTA